MDLNSYLISLTSGCWSTCQCATRPHACQFTNPGPQQHTRL